MVAELVLHGPEEDAADVDVRLRDKAVSSQRPTLLLAGVSVPYKRSPVFSSRRTAMPSIMLAAELPKNLLRGLRVPSTRMLCSGAMKK